MRRAGYEVRVLPLETGSYEANPPHLLEFIRRDLRWCQGNLQYRRLIGLPGLKPVSRMQLVLAILMFLGSPAWLGFMTSAAILGMVTDYMPYRPDTGALLFFTVLTMVFAPKLATVADVLARPDLRKAFGGPIRVVVSVLAEIVYSAMLAPIMAVAHSLFMGGLLFGKTIGWGRRHVVSNDCLSCWRPASSGRRHSSDLRVLLGFPPSLSIWCGRSFPWPSGRFWQLSSR